MILGVRGCFVFVVGYEGRFIVGRISRVEGRKGLVWISIVKEGFIGNVWVKRGCLRWDLDRARVGGEIVYVVWIKFLKLYI